MGIKTTSKAKKAKRISISLSEREGELLARYAKEMGTTRPAAVRRFVRECLRQYRSQSKNVEPKNQLGLFDSMQIDIFNITSKTND